MPGDASAAATPAAANAVNSIFTNASRIDAGSHTTILQSLDRRVDGICLRADQFAASVDSWAGTPVIFAQEHPDLAAYDADPEAELKRIGGRVVGEVTNPRIETSGHPRFVGELGFGGDDEVEQLCADGQLGTSTAFRTAPITNATITSPPRPHHVLVFKETPDGTRPKDPGTWILNATVPPMDITNAGRELSAKNIGRLQALSDALNGAREALKELLGGAQEPAPVANAVTPGVTAITTEGSLEDRTQKIALALKRIVNPRWPDGSEGWINVLATFEDSIIYSPSQGGFPDEPRRYRIPYTLDGETVTFGEPVEVEAAFVEIAHSTQDTDMTEPEVQTAIANAVAEKDTELAHARTENAALKADLAKVEQARKDAEWQDVKNAIIPVGWTDTPEKETELRTMAETRPLEFAKKIATIPRPDATKTVEEGSEFAHAEVDESIAVTRELRKATGTLR